MSRQNWAGDLTEQGLDSIEVAILMICESSTTYLSKDQYKGTSTHQV